MVSSCLCCLLCLAMILGRRGIWTSYISPFVVFPTLYLLSLGLPSLFYAFGFGGDDKLLKPDYIPAVNQYASWLLVTFYVGYILAEYAIRAGAKEKNLSKGLEQPARPESCQEGKSALPPFVGETSCNLVFLLSVGALVIGILSTGWEETWEGSMVRGTGQWEAHHFHDYLLLLVQACLINSTITAGVIRAWFPARRLWVAPLAWCLFLAPGGSRGSVIPFALFLTTSVVAGRKTSVMKMGGIALLTLLSVMYIGLVRPRFVGLADFVGSLGSGGEALATVSDPLDAVTSLGTTTATFWVARDIVQRDVVAQLWRILSPVPSFIMEQDIAATNLVAYLGHIGGNQGNPFPVLGEMYVFFGWTGVLLGFIGGFVMAVLFEKSRRSRPDAYPFALLWPSLYSACVLGGIMSLHSGLRTTTRLPLWAIIWFFCFTTAVTVLREPLLKSESLPLFHFIPRRTIGNVVPRRKPA